MIPSAVRREGSRVVVSSSQALFESLTPETDRDMAVTIVDASVTHMSEVDRHAALSSAARALSSSKIENVGAPHQSLAGWEKALLCVAAMKNESMERDVVRELSSSGWLPDEVFAILNTEGSSASVEGEIQVPSSPSKQVHPRLPVAEYRYLRAPLRNDHDVLTAARRLTDSPTYAKLLSSRFVIPLSHILNPEKLGVHNACVEDALRKREQHFDRLEKRRASGDRPAEGWDGCLPLLAAKSIIVDLQANLVRRRPQQEESCGSEKEEPTDVWRARTLESLLKEFPVLGLIILRSRALARPIHSDVAMNKVAVAFLTNQLIAMHRITASTSHENEMNQRGGGYDPAPVRLWATQAYELPEVSYETAALLQASLIQAFTFCIRDTPPPPRLLMGSGSRDPLHNLLLAAFDWLADGSTQLLAAVPPVKERGHPPLGVVKPPPGKWTEHPHVDSVGQSLGSCIQFLVGGRLLAALPRHTVATTAGSPSDESDPSVELSAEEVSVIRKTQRDAGVAPELVLRFQAALHQQKLYSDELTVALRVWPSGLMPRPSIASVSAAQRVGEGVTTASSQNAWTLVERCMMRHAPALVTGTSPLLRRSPTRSLWWEALELATVAVGKGWVSSQGIQSAKNKALVPRLLEPRHVGALHVALREMSRTAFNRAEFVGNRRQCFSSHSTVKVGRVGWYEALQLHGILSGEWFGNQQKGSSVEIPETQEIAVKENAMECTSAGSEPTHELQAADIATQLANETRRGIATVATALRACCAIASLRDSEEHETFARAVGVLHALAAAESDPSGKAVDNAESIRKAVASALIVMPVVNSLPIDEEVALLTDVLFTGPEGKLQPMVSAPLGLLLIRIGCRVVQSTPNAAAGDEKDPSGNAGVPPLADRTCRLILDDPATTLNPSLACDAAWEAIEVCGKIVTRRGTNHKGSLLDDAEAATSAKQEVFSALLSMAVKMRTDETRSVRVVGEQLEAGLGELAVDARGVALKLDVAYWQQLLGTAM